jgi:hypothetical protein
MGTGHQVDADLWRMGRGTKLMTTCPAGSHRIAFRYDAVPFPDEICRGVTDADDDGGTGLSRLLGSFSGLGYSLS